MKNKPTFLLTVVFICGMTTMAVEMSASRLLAPYFGTSLLIWANLIGLIMIYLTAGYYLGGRLADRRPQEAVLYQLTAWAGFTIGLVPFVAQPILRFSTVGFASYSLGIFGGSLIGVILLFAVPIIILGCVSPFAIRLQARSVESTGKASGNIYALSTLGSILGTFLPVLFLIPVIGTRKTLLSFSLILLAFSLVGLWRTVGRRAWWSGLLVLAILLLTVFVPGGIVKAADGLVYEAESAYNYIQVVRSGDNTALVLNEGHAWHSIYNPKELLTGGPWDYFLIAPYFNANYRMEDVKSLYVLGLAAGTVPKQYTQIYGPIAIDGAEIDPEIIQIGRRYFAMNEPNLNAIPQDGRYFLQRTNKKYDVIGIDAYRQPYIPFHLTTREFFMEVRDHLTPRGVAMINAGRTPTDDRLVQALASTMRAVFPSVFVIDVPTGWNSMVVGTNQATNLENFQVNLVNLPDSNLRSVAESALAQGIRPVTASGLVFTDDRAPVEQVIDQIILGYVSGRH
ncbi:MAG: fused MFS/spermidine synthase [Chloroflexi bacterium]|nr:fused MFS/spermidine synthase [Chloroflexota bacterium]